jgi:hypothetical protein
MSNQIDREKVYTYFEKYHGSVQKSTNDWYSTDCPICGGKGKFALNFNYLTGKCWKGCFNGFLLDAVRIFHNISYFEARELIDSMDVTLRLPAAINRATKNSKIALPYGYHSILEGTGSLAVRAREYLENRGFDLNKMDRLGVGYVDVQNPDLAQDYFGRIIIPLKRDGSLMYFLGMTFIDDPLRYKNPSKELCGVGKSELFFGEENLYLYKDIFLTEGWACSSTMGNGISMQGSVASVIQRNIIIKSPIESVYITTDAGFYKNGLMIAQHILPHKKVKVLNLDWFQENGIGKDPNAVGKENILNLERDTPWMDIKFLYSQLKVYA